MNRFLKWILAILLAVVIVVFFIQKSYYPMGGDVCIVDKASSPTAILLP